MFMPNQLDICVSQLSKFINNINIKFAVLSLKNILTMNPSKDNSRQMQLSGQSNEHKKLLFCNLGNQAYQQRCLNTDYSNFKLQSIQKKDLLSTDGEIPGQDSESDIRISLDSITPGNNLDFYVQGQNRHPNQFSRVFSESKSYLGKNNNETKYQLKFFIKHFKTVGSRIFEQDKGLYKQMMKLINRYNREPENSEDYNLKDRGILFGENNQSSDRKRRSFLARKTAHSIMRNITLPYTLRNNKMKHRLKYLVTIKMQMIRARNSQLMLRTQIP